MSVLHQAIAAAAPADAVTGEALSWQALLRRQGVGGEVVAEHVHPELAGRVRRLDEGGASLLRTGAVLLHYSIDSAAADAALEAPGPLGVVYHNITPGYLLAEANPTVAAACNRGRAGLVRLRQRTRVLIAVSAFNAAELEALGLGAVLVVPLLAPRRPRPVSPLRPAADPPAIVTVGRVVPSKRIEDVIRVVCLLQRVNAPEATLWVVGGWDGFERYRAALDDLVRDLGMPGVTFTGRVSDTSRDAHLRGASAYLCMSVHEGFCAPLVEAMAWGTPVVARACGAVPETLGGAGLVIDGEDLALFAEAVYEAATSDVLRAALAARATARLRALAPGRAAEVALAAVAPLLEAP